LELKRGTATKVEKSEVERAEGEWRKWRGVCGRRREIVREMWGVIEEVLPEGTEKGEVRERLGLDD